MNRYFDSYGSDPRRIQYAGSETDGLSVDYKQKYAGQLQVIKDNYATFAVPYNGEDNNDYVDGKGFCCTDGSLEAAQARALSRAMKNNFQESDAYEKMQFYYHPDHLGSSSYITNLDGEVVQHIEYVPFGEVFVEERNNIWNTPYLFNAKEFDEETGLYYYGARYYDPRVSLWISVDPMQEENLSVSTYAYTLNNPVRFKDEDGKIPVETIWDAANVAMGVGSLINNIRSGNIGAAAVDGLGVVVDAAATIIPYVPGGVSSGIKAYRAGKVVVNATKTAKAVKSTTQGSKQITRRAAFRQAKRDAGVPTSQNFKTHKKVDAAKNGKSGRRGIEYEFEVSAPYGSKESRFVQDHFEGHAYMDGRVDNTPHFNIHQKKGTTRLKGENNHYPYIMKRKK